MPAPKRRKTAKVLLLSFCSYICNDAGVTVLGKKVEFTGKIMILLLAIPIMANILNSILSIM